MESAIIAIGGLYYKHKNDLDLNPVLYLIAYDDVCKYSNEGTFNYKGYQTSILGCVRDNDGAVVVMMRLEQHTHMPHLGSCSAYLISHLMPCHFTISAFLLLSIKLVN
jgi:hypothetical protein